MPPAIGPCLGVERRAARGRDDRRRRVRRGFCSICGSVLFWDPIGRDKIAIAMGAFDAPTGTRLAMHIFTADKGDYYDIADGLPQKPL